MTDVHDTNSSMQNKEEVENKSKTTKRSKDENRVRKYECIICHKTYLSYPALYTHKRNKHRNDVDNAKPAKLKSSPEGTSINEKSVAVSADSLDYFNTAERNGHTNFIYFSDIFRDAFNDIFVDNWEAYKIYLKEVEAKNREWDKYNLHIEFMKQHNPEVGVQSSDSVLISCDMVLAEYLTIVSKRTNPSYFKKLVKFVMLFREFLNIHHKCDKYLEYTASNTAEEAPDNSNEFVLEFLGYDDPKFGFRKEESIDLTLNLCQWMLDERYTASKLTIK